MDVYYKIQDYLIKVNIINLTSTPLIVADKGIIIPTTEIVSLIDERVSIFTLTHGLDTHGISLFITAHKKIKKELSTIYPELIFRHFRDAEQVSLSVTIEQKYGSMERCNFHVDVSDIMPLQDFNRLYYLLYINSDTSFRIHKNYVTNQFSISGVFTSGVILTTLNGVISFKRGDKYLLYKTAAGYEMATDRGLYYFSEKAVLFNGEEVFIDPLLPTFQIQ